MGRGPEEVILPFVPDESLAYATPRMKGSFSTRVDEVMAQRPRERDEEVVMNGSEFIVTFKVGHQSHKARGVVLYRDSRAYGDPDDRHEVVEKILVHEAKRYENGWSLPHSATKKESQAAEAAVRRFLAHTQALAA